MGVLFRTLGPTSIAVAVLVLVLISGLVAMVLQHNNCLDQTELAAVVLKEARETHLPWIRYLGESLPSVPEVGNIMFHLEVVREYDTALEALNAACSYPGA
jgi:hypothetical protein